MNALDSPTCTPFTFILMGVAIVSEFLPAVKVLIGHDDLPADIDEGDELFESIDIGECVGDTMSLYEDLTRRLSKSRGCVHALLLVVRSRMFETLTGIPVGQILKDARSMCGLRRYPKHVVKEAVGRTVFQSCESAGSSGSDLSTPPSSTEEEKENK